MNREVGLELPHIYDRILNATPPSGREPTGSLKKFIEQSGRKSHSKENKTSICVELTLSVSLNTYFGAHPYIMDSKETNTDREKI